MFSRLLCLLLLVVASKVSADEWSEKHLGFSGFPIQGQEEQIKSLGFAKLPVKKGILVCVVNPNTPTAKGGLLPLAIVTSVNRKPVGSEGDVQEAIAGIEIGDDVVIAGQTLRNNVWKSGTVKTKVMTKRAVLEATMVQSVDKIDNLTVWRHRFTAEEQVNRVELFVSQLGSEKPNLHVETIYIAKDWLFVKALTAANKGQKATIDLRVLSADNRVKGGWILERNAAAVPDDFASLLCDYSCIVRFDGKNENYDHRQSVSECWINRDVFDFFRMITTSP
jgi:hypothetical protein